MTSNRDCRPKLIGTGFVFSDRVRTRLQDIVENADWISEDIAGLDAGSFQRNRSRADAVERCLQRITEAIIQIGDGPEADLCLDVPWAEIRSLGNRLRHDYRRIDRRIIFDIATREVPALREAALQVLNR